MRRRAQLNASRHALTIALAALALSACGGSSLPVSSANNANVGVQPPSGKRTFHYIDRRQSFKVPVGVTQITVVALGAAGGGTAFGHGGRTYAVIPVTPGERLAVFVGGTPTGAKGGFNGGGPAGSGAYGSSTGYGGGGASDVRQGGEQLSNRVLIAAGGGGQGGFNEDKTGAGGKGGGSVGGTGGVGYGQYYSVKCYYGGRLRSDSYFGYYGGCGGTGGTQTQGGSGGGGGLGPFCYGTPGNAGSLGKGGAGGAGGSYECGGVGGGGGGGYYGGGGGGEGSDYGSSPIGGGGGGGGGSSYVEPNAIKSRTWAGWKSATTNGLVVLSWR